MQCQFCQHYQGLGRQGGDCKRLSAPVQGTWGACCMVIPVFGETAMAEVDALVPQTVAP